MKRMRCGQSIVELLMAIAVAGLILPSVLTGLVTSVEGKTQQKQRNAAIGLVREGAEAVRSIRDSSWNAIAVNGTYHPVAGAGVWSLATGAESVAGFSRSVTVADGRRDSAGDIVASGGSVDPSTKKVTVTVSWGTWYPTSVTSTLYLTRLENIVYTETTAADFNKGTGTKTVVTTTGGGAVTLGAGGSKSWCEPDLTLASLDLPKQGVANAITAIEGHVFVGTGDNASGVSYAHVTISGSDPPVPQIAGTFDGYKTNAVFGEAGYGYIATDTNSKEVVIMNLSSTPYAESGYFNLPGAANASSIYVSGSVGFVTDGNRLYSFDLSSKSGSRPALDADGVALSGNAAAIMVVGQYVYVAVNATPTQMDIVDAANPANLTVVGHAQVAGEGGRDIVVNSTGTRAYLVTALSATKKEFFIIDTSVKTGNRPTVGSYDTNGMDPKAVTVVPGNRAIAVGWGGETYQVLDTTDESNPVRCGGLVGAGNLNDIASVVESDGDAFSYILTTEANSELRIIKGGPGGNFSTQGMFESQTLSLATPSAFNRFIVNADKPNQTDITYQVAVADRQAGSCTGVSFDFVGPDKTAATYFATGSAIPMDDDGAGYENPGQCFRYRAYLKTQDAFTAPILYDFTVNYSP